MQFPPSQLPTLARQAGRFPSTLTNSNHGVPAVNSSPSMLHFPQTGVTPPHPHPVAPFPPPPRSYATVRHGPVSPAPHPNLQQPFYSLAFTHLPPHARPRPLPHAAPISLYPSSSGSVHPSPPWPSTRDVHHLPSAPSSSPAVRMPLSVPAAGQTISVPLSCKNCGHYMVANLSAGQGQMLNYRIPPTPPPPPPPPPSPLPPHSPLPPPTSVASSRPHVLPSQFFKYHPMPRPQPSYPLQVATPQSLVLHYPGSHASQITPQPADHGLRFGARETQHRSTAFTSNVRRSTSDTVHSGGDGGMKCKGVFTNPRLPRKKGFSASSKPHEVIPQPSSRIIPYRERKKRTSVEVHARQQLELEFAHLPKPTQSQMAELAAKLGVSKDFVRVWFTNRRQKEKHQESASGKVGTTIPSLTHDITVEVASTGAASAEGMPNATVVIFTTRQS